MSLLDRTVVFEQRLTAGQLYWLHDGEDGSCFRYNNSNHRQFGVPFGHEDEVEEETTEDTTTTTSRSKSSFSFHDRFAILTTTTTTSQNDSSTAAEDSSIETKKLLSKEDQEWIQEMDAGIPQATPLLASYDTVQIKTLIESMDGKGGGRTGPPFHFDYNTMQDYVQDFVHALTRDVSVKTNLQFQLPDPLFDDSIMSLQITIPPHSGTDLESIAFDTESKGRRRLTLKDDPDAFRNLKQTGVYKKKNDLGHEYHITFHWYPGRRRIAYWQHQAWAEIWYQWGVQLPSLVVGGGPGESGASLAKGLWEFMSSVGIILNRLTSIVPSTFPKYTAEEIEEELAKEYVTWLKDSKGYSVIASEVIDHSRGANKDVKRYTAILKHLQDNESTPLDLRMLIPDVREKVDVVLDAVRQQIQGKVGDQRMSIIATHIPSLGEEGAVQRYLELWQEAYLQALENRRQGLNRLSTSPNLTDVILQHERASFIVGRMEEAKRLEQNEAMEDAMQRWKETHSVLSTSDKFTSRQEESIRAKLEEDIPLIAGVKEALWDIPLIVRVKEALWEARLDTAALLLETQNDFQQSEQFADLTKTLQSERKPVVIKIPLLKIPSRWTAVKRNPFCGTSYYEIVTSHTVRIQSSQPLWRWKAFAIRYVSWMWNSSFLLIGKNSVALQRWNVMHGSFQRRLPSVNEETGEFNTTLVRTLRGRMAALLDWKRRVLTEARNGEHIIRLSQGLYLDMCWAHMWTTIGTVFGSVAIISWTIAETIAVVFGGTVVLVTSPIWSLVGNVGRFVFNTFVYDLELDRGEMSRGPLLQNLFGTFTLVKAILGIAYHALKGAGVAVIGETRHLWNRVWHGLMTGVIKRAEVPTKAEGFFWSTSGPGMKTPFVLVDADTGTLALMAYLSQQELSVAAQEMKDDLQEPRRILEERIEQDSGRAMRLQDISIVDRSLSRTELEHKEQLKRFHSLANVERRYAELLHEVKENTMIRMTAEELEKLMSKAVPVVRKFYLERCFSRLPSKKIIVFWESRHLVPGDWQGLVNYILSDVFTSDIIVPLEEASDDLVIDANQHSGLERIVQEALQEQGIVTGASTEYRVGHPIIQSKNLPFGPHFRDIPIRFSPPPFSQTLGLADRPLAGTSANAGPACF